MVYLDSSSQDKEALEAQIRLMKLKEMGDAQGALATFDNVKTLWKKPGCGDKCDEYQAQIKSGSWIGTARKRKSDQRARAYIKYTSLFPEDEEMLMWVPVWPTSASVH